MFYFSFFCIHPLFEFYVYTQHTVSFPIKTVFFLDSLVFSAPCSHLKFTFFYCIKVERILNFQAVSGNLSLPLRYILAITAFAAPSGGNHFTTNFSTMKKPNAQKPPLDVIKFAFSKFHIFLKFPNFNLLYVSAFGFIFFVY